MWLALKVAQNIIVSNTSALAICVYHRRDDLIKILAFTERICPRGKQYRFYLRAC